MRKIILLILIATAFALNGYSQENKEVEKPTTNASQKTVEEKRRELLANWEMKKEKNPREAYQIAVEYVEKFPDDKSEKAQTLKKWLEANAKLKDDNQKTTNGDKKNSDGGKTAPVTDAPESSAGTWTMVVQTKQGDMQFTLILQQDDGANLSGKVESPYGEGTVTGGKVEGNAFNLDIHSDYFDVKLKGTIEKDKMKGTLTTSSPDVPELAFAGTRSK